MPKDLGQTPLAGLPQTTRKSKVQSDNDWFDRNRQPQQTLADFRLSEPRRRDYQRQHWIPAVFVVLVGLGLLGFLLDSNSDEQSTTTSNAEALGSAKEHGVAADGPSLLAHADNPPDETQQGYTTYYISRAQARPEPTTYYQCVRGGQVVLSDAPCAADAPAQVLDPSKLNHYSAPPPVRLQASSNVLQYNPPALQPRQRTHADAGETQCHYLEQMIANLNARMRSGYGSQEGEYLHEQYRDLTDAYYKAHCTKF